MAFPAVSSGGGGGGAVSSVNGMIGDVVITPTHLGLGEVDNTSDLDKAISTLTQASLDSKKDKGVITAVTYNANGDPLTATISGIDYTFTYDADNNMLTAIGGGETKTLTWVDGEFTGMVTTNT